MEEAALIMMLGQSRKRKQAAGRNHQVQVWVLVLWLAGVPGEFQSPNTPHKVSKPDKERLARPRLTLMQSKCAAEALAL